jgi:hypothetical protein
MNRFLAPLAIVLALTVGAAAASADPMSKGFSATKFFSDIQRHGG